MHNIIEYLPLILWAAGGFIAPAIVSAIGLWWLWRQRNPRVTQAVQSETRDEQRREYGRNAGEKGSRAA